MAEETVLSGKYMAYPEYKDSGEEWLGEVPTHWDVIQIKHLSAVKRGASPRPIDDAKYFDEDGEYAWTRIADVTASDVYLIKAPQRLSSLGSSLSVKLEPESLFLSIAGTVGKPCITGMKACIHDGFVYFPELKIPSKFLFYVFAGEQAYKGLGKFGTQLNLNTDTVGGIKIGCTIIEELEEIVHFLDHETSKIDTLIDKQQQLITLLKEKRQAVISHAVTKGLNPNAPMRDSGVEWLGEVPAHWDVVPIKYIVSMPVTDGPHETPEFLDEGVPFISAEAVSDGRVNFDKIRAHISEKDNERYSLKYSPMKFDIYMVKSGATTGVTAIVETDFKFNIWSPLAVIRCKEDSYPYFVLNFMRSRNFQEAVELNWSFGTQQNIGMGVIENLHVTRPPIAEAKAISEKLTRQSNIFDAVIDKALSQIELMKERRTALISAAVTGKVDVRHWQAPVTTNGKEVNP
jgi:type I restriction enzyme S subunit